MWGHPDESEFWDQREKARNQKASDKPTTTDEPERYHLSELKTVRVAWKPPPPDSSEHTLAQKFAEAQQKPLPLTYTFRDAKTDMKDPVQRKRLFGNLHRQLVLEVQRARNSGSSSYVDLKLWEEGLQHASKGVETYLDLDMETFEARIREIVRELIMKRQQFGFEQERLRHQALERQA